MEKTHAGFMIRCHDSPSGWGHDSPVRTGKSPKINGGLWFLAGKIIDFHGPWRHHGELLNIFRQQFQTINKDELDPMGKLVTNGETFDR